MFGAEVAVLVADISGSTALYEKIGNEAAFNQISTCLDTMRASTERHGGRFIHSKGDDVLCTFALAGDAFAAAMEMMTQTQGSGLSLHSGLDFGQVLQARGDVFGDCVNTTARLAGYAISGEVLCSHSFYQQLNPDLQGKLRFLEKWRFKGKSEGERVYAFSGAGQEKATQFSMSDTAVDAFENEVSKPKGQAALRLVFNGESYLCTPTQDITMGRSVTCDIVIAKPWVSRKHATIEIRREHAYLRDTSSNGTFICFDGQNPVLARREALLLPDKCALSLTKKPDDPEAVRIECEIMTVE